MQLSFQLLPELGENFTRLDIVLSVHSPLRKIGSDFLWLLSRNRAQHGGNDMASVTSQQGRDGIIYVF